MTNNNRRPYWLLSGEGELGTWERVVTTPLGIKQRLTRERFHGDRWAYACEYPYETNDGSVAGFDVEDGGPRFLPNDARADVVTRHPYWTL